MNSTKEKGLSIKGLGLIFVLVFLAASCNRSSQPTITIGSHKINVEIADTPKKRSQGLSNRDFLDADSGMLFVFEKPEHYSFWMKDMKFPLDFIWIRDGRVVEITSNVPFTDQAKIYTPSQPIDSMLEVNAGFAAENNLKVGDSVSVD